MKAPEQAERAASHWECPCGTEKPKPGARTVPVRTIVSLREPWCPFCKKPYCDDYRRATS